MLKLLMKKLGTPPIEPDNDGGSAGVSVPGASASACASAAPDVLEWLVEPDCTEPEDLKVVLL